MIKRNFSPVICKKVIKDSKRYLNFIKSIIKKETNYVERLTKLSNNLLQSQINEMLKKIPLEELNKNKEGIRIKTLKDYKYNTIYDLQKASIKDLEDIDGISLEMARLIKRRVNAIIKDTSKFMKLEISVDKKTKEKENLILEVVTFAHLKTYMDIYNDFLNEHKDYVNLKCKELSCGTNALSWFFTLSKYKDRANASFNEYYEFYLDSISDKYEDEKTEIDKILAISKKKAWELFTLDPSRYLSFLDSVVPNLLSDIDTRYGLPEDLANDILNEELFLDGFRGTLRRYQEWGCKYIIHQKRVLLGDEMGLGKTIQAIAAMVSLSNTGCSHFAVVCPLSVLTNWEREIKKFSNLEVFKAYSKNISDTVNSWVNDGGVLITTYETLKKIELDKAFKFDMLIVDEAHYIKNENTLRAKNVLNMSLKSKRLVYMTGTPIENSVTEMLKLISDLQPRVAFDVKKIAYLSSALEFKEKIAPVYYRRRRTDVLKELPELIESVEWCDLLKDEERLYENAILNKDRTTARRLSWMIGDYSKSSKAIRLKEIIEMARVDGRKVLVFSFYKETIAQIKSFLGDCALDVIHGGVSTEKRQQIIDEFNLSEAGKVLIAQIQAGGTGLNIQSASVVVICEPQYKPSIENQAISRAYRMGQIRNVLVYKLVCPNTIEERILNILATKQNEFNAFADESLVAMESIEIDQNSINDIFDEEFNRINEKK